MSKTKKMEISSDTARRIDGGLVQQLKRVQVACFAVDMDGRIDGNYDRGCPLVFQQSLEDKTFFELLDLKGSALQGVKYWLRSIFYARIPFDFLKSMGPQHYLTSQQRYLTLEYKTLKVNGVIHRLIVSAQDKTELFQKESDKRSLQEKEQLLYKAMEDKKAFEEFLENAEICLNDLAEEVELQENEMDVFGAFHCIHMMREKFTFYGLGALRKLAHNLEIHLYFLKSQYRDPSLSEIEYVYKVSMKILHLLDETFEEFKILRATRIGVENEDSFSVKGDFVNESYQKNINGALQEFKPWLEGLSADFKKEIYYKLDPCDVDIPYEPYAGLIDSLSYILENSLVHGIESQEERGLFRKSHNGTIKVSAKYLGITESMMITIEDDGCGIDVKAFRDRLQRQNLLNLQQYQSMSDYEVLQYLLKMGVKSDDEVVSNTLNGMGLERVHYEATKLGGRVEIHSEKNLYTLIKVSFPLLAPFPAGKSYIS